MGAGVAGSTLGARLCQLGISNVVVAPSHPLASEAWEVLSPKMVGPLASAGLTGIEQVGQPLTAFHSVFGNDSVEGFDYAFWTGAPAWKIERSALRNWLHDRCLEVGVDLRRDVEIAAFTRGEDHWLIALASNGETTHLRPRLVVEALGRKTSSTFIPDLSRAFADRQVAATLNCDWCENTIYEALVESVEDGWWFGLRTSTRKGMVTLFTDSDLLPNRLDRSEMISRSFSRTTHLAGIALDVDSASLRLTDARTSIRSRLVAPGWLALGDAGWTIDPLSGSGTLKAVNGALKTAEAIQAWCEQGNEKVFASLEDAQRREALDAVMTQRRHYGAETRWATSPYWSRRLGKESGL